MAFSLGSVAVRLMGDTKHFRREFRRSERTLSGFAKTARRAGGHILATGGLIAAGLAKHQLELVEQTRQASKQLNVSQQDLDSLRAVADKINQPFNQFLITLQRVTRRAGDAAGGAKEMRRTFGELGIDPDKFLALGAVERVSALNSAFMELESNSRRQAIAFKLLDTEGQAFLRLTQLGAGGVLEFADKARKMGAVSDEAARNAEGINDFLDELKLKAYAAGNTLLELGGKAKRFASGAVQGVKDFLGIGPDELERAKLAEAEKVAAAKERAHRAARAESIASASSLSTERQREFLKRSSTRTEGAQVDRRTTFLDTARRTGASSTERQALRESKRTNELLGQLIGVIRNNATGATVTFVG